MAEAYPNSVFYGFDYHAASIERARRAAERAGLRDRVLLDIKTKTHGQKFYPKVEAKEFSSRLEIPSGRDPLQNAWLTITLNYSLSFLDSKNPEALFINTKAAPEALMCETQIRRNSRCWSGIRIRGRNF
jgi:hypothetical protein